MHFTGKFPKTNTTKLARNTSRKNLKEKLIRWGKNISVGFMLVAGMVALMYANNNFLECQIIRPLPVTLSPAPGKYVLEANDNGLEISMFTSFGGDIWYTTDGSNPLRGNWVNYENPSLRHYDGIPVIIPKNTTVNVVSILPATMQITGVQRMSYNITRNKTEGELKPATPVLPMVRDVMPTVPKLSASSNIKRTIQYGLR